MKVCTYFKDGLVIDHLAEQGTNKRISGTGCVHCIDMESLYLSVEVLWFFNKVKNFNEVVWKHAFEKQNPSNSTKENLNEKKKRVEISKPYAASV